jgi:hypothetical protein
MGSTLNGPAGFNFDIAINDPDTGNPKNKITKIDIVKDGGAIVQTYNPTHDYAVRWKCKIDDSTSKFFFIRIWNWLAPVWTGR